MTLYIKNMVCNRCIMVVVSELKRLGFNPLSVTLGEAVLDHQLTNKEKEKVRNSFESLGFELIDDKKSCLIEHIKNLIINLVHHNSDHLKINLSDYLGHQLHVDYNYLSSMFSEIEGSTIEKYFIAQKIEKVKELLVYDELTLSQIADKLNYSSVAHLSSQFKKVTGLTPSHFKQIGENKRKPLDKVWPLS